MESRVRLLGHSVHQMLVPFPLGLLGTSVVFDLIHLLGESAWAYGVAYGLIAAGVIAGLLAAPFGLIDWLAIPARTRAKAIGAMHGGGNLVVVLLFAVSWSLRGDGSAPPPVSAWVVSFCGAGIALVTAWLGGELVSRLGIGVSPNANPNAESSLRGPAEQPAEAVHPRAR